MKLKQSQWRHFKDSFLEYNQCTVDQFNQAWLDFMALHQNRPNTRAYRLFARQWGIPILHDPMIPAESRAVICVTVAVIKVLAETEQEARAAVEEIMDGKKPGVH
jgi:hypothetical protein